MLGRLGMVCPPPKLRLSCWLLQKDSCWIIRINVSAKWQIFNQSSLHVFLDYIKKKHTRESISHTQISSFHQQEFVLLAKDPHEALLPNYCVHCIVSLKRSNWKRVEQRFHSHLPWTKSWMSEWSKVPCFGFLGPPKLN